MNEVFPTFLRLLTRKNTALCKQSSFHGREGVIPRNCKNAVAWSVSVRQTRHCYQSVKKDELKSRTNIILGALLLVSSLRSFSNRKTIIGISILLWIVYFLSNLCPFPPAVISQIEFKKRGLPHIHIIGLYLNINYKLLPPLIV